MSEKRKMRLLLSKCNICLLILGTILTILGLAAIIFFPKVHDGIVTKALSFGPETIAFKKWQKPPTPITMDIYFFNWTNPGDINNPDVKPKFAEVGPYRYRQFKEKVNVTWNNDNQTITYRYLKHFYIDENSPRKDSDVITTINMVALSAATMANDWNFLLKQPVKFSLASSEISVTKNVSELMFDGYVDSILATASAIPFLSSSKVDRFGWFYGRNGSVGGDGVFNMAFSPDNNYGTLQSWEFDKKTKFYEEQCANIYGSAGELYPRNVRPTRIDFFSPEMCRTMNFYFQEKVNIKGLECYKFSPGDEIFDNGTRNEENKCFCGEKCHPSGVLDVHACRQDAPIFLSLPHFYNADGGFVKKVEGLRPEKEKHELYITLEPNTGVIADISARMQINAHLQPLPDFWLFENVPELMFPVFWFNQKVVMSDELAASLSLLFFKIPNIVKFVGAFVVIVGLLCILSVILFVACCKQKNRKEHKITREEVPLKTKY